MKENIYILLNEMDHQAETCEDFQAKASDVKKWKASFRLRKKASPGWIRYAAAAAACVCVMIAAAQITGGNVYAKMSTAVYNLSKLLGIQKDLSPYSTIVGKLLKKMVWLLL